MIKITDVSKQFPNETAIDYNDITFEKGKSYMLLGASGCGKSTLLNMIAGILSPEKGTIEIAGEDMSKKSQKQKDKLRIEKIGYIFQDLKRIGLIYQVLMMSLSLLKYLIRKIKKSSIFQAVKSRE